MKVNPKLFSTPQLNETESVKAEAKDEKAAVPETPKNEPKPQKIDCSISDIVAKMQETTPIVKDEERDVEYDELVKQFEFEYKRVIGADFEGAKDAVLNLIKMAETIREMAPESEKKAWDAKILELRQYLKDNFPDEPTHRSEGNKAEGSRQTTFVAIKKSYQEYQEQRKEFLNRVERYLEQSTGLITSERIITPESLTKMAHSLFDLIDSIQKLLDSVRPGSVAARQEIYEALSRAGINIKG